MPSLASARKITFDSAVSCKWTRQLHHLDSIKSSFSLNWGLFSRSSTYMASLWSRNTTDTRTLLRINNVCCAVAREKIITGGVNSIKVTWRFRDVYPRLSQNIDPMLNLPGKMNLQTPCWINWNLLDLTPVVSNLLFPRAVIKQFINWLMNKIFWNTVRNVSFFFCVQTKGIQSFWNIWQEFHEAHLDDFLRPESRRAKLSDIAPQQNNFPKNRCGELRKRTSFFITVIKAQWCTLIGTYGIKPLIMTGWASFFCRDRSNFTLKAFLKEQTSRDLWKLGQQSQARRRLKN